MIVTGIDRDAMRIGVGGDILQPLVRLGINDAEYRPGGHISGRQIIAVVAGVVPGLVHAAHIVDGSNDVTRSAIDHVLVERESHAIMVRATYQKVVTRSLNDTGGH